MEMKAAFARELTVMQSKIVGTVEVVVSQKMQGPTYQNPTNWTTSFMPQIVENQQNTLPQPPTAVHQAPVYLPNDQCYRPDMSALLLSEEPPARLRLPVAAHQPAEEGNEDSSSTEYTSWEEDDGDEGGDAEGDDEGEQEGEDEEEDSEEETDDGNGEA